MFFSLLFPLVKFPPEQLKAELMPVYEKLFNQVPEGLPFRYPVDPVQEQIPVSQAWVVDGCSPCWGLCCPCLARFALVLRTADAFPFPFSGLLWDRQGPNGPDNHSKETWGWVLPGAVAGNALFESPRHDLLYPCLYLGQMLWINEIIIEISFVFLKWWFIWWRIGDMGYLKLTAAEYFPPDWRFYILAAPCTEITPPLSVVLSEKIKNFDLRSFYWLFLLLVPDCGVPLSVQAF